MDTTVAEIVGRTLGRVHAAVAGHDAVRNRIGDRTPFVQFRIEPYHRTVANRHPELAEPIEAEIDRILAVDRTPVHGDYSPKNVLVDRSGDAPAAGSSISRSHTGAIRRSIRPIGCTDRLGALGGDLRQNHRGSGRRHGRRPDQDRIARALGAAVEVQPPFENRAESIGLNSPSGFSSWRHTSSVVRSGCVFAGHVTLSKRSFTYGTRFDRPRAIRVTRLGRQQKRLIECRQYLKTDFGDPSGRGVVVDERSTRLLLCSTHVLSYHLRLQAAFCTTPRSIGL